MLGARAVGNRMDVQCAPASRVRRIWRRIAAFKAPVRQPDVGWVRKDGGPSDAQPLPGRPRFISIACSVDGAVVGAAPSISNTKSDERGAGAC
jgi:hypothetical protein